MTGLTNLFLGIKNIAINFSTNEGIFLPGYMNQPHFLGQKWGEMSPGIPFVFGSQEDIRYRAANNGWITKDTLLNSLYASSTINRVLGKSFNKFSIVSFE